MTEEIVPFIDTATVVTNTSFDLVTGRLGFYSSGPEGQVIFPAIEGLGWIDGQWSGETHYALDGVATPRPVPGLPSSRSIAAATDWQVANVPAGTAVLIDGEEMGTVDTTGLTLNFALAGVWRVDLRPPFPWLDASCEVTVT